MPPAYVIEEAIVAFADDRINRAGRQADVVVFAQHVGDQRIAGAPDAERIGQQNWRLDHAAFANLFKASRFAKAVDGVYSGSDFFAKDIAVVGEDGGYARAHRI